MTIKIFLLFSSIFLAHNSFADIEICSNPALSSKPVLADGRPMPLGIYAEKVRRSVFVKNTCKDLDATVFFCYLSHGAVDVLEQKMNCKLSLKADHIDTFKLLGLADRSSSITPQIAQQGKSKLLSQYHFFDSQGKSSTGPASDLGSLLTRIDKFEAITSGQDWKALNANHEWVGFSALKNDDILRSETYLTAQEQKLVTIESLYEKTHPFGFAILICLIGFVVSLGFAKSKLMKKLTFVSVAFLVLVECSGIAMRVMISGRAPITNMFETVMWVGFGVFLLSLALGAKLRNPGVVSAGFAGNMISLFMMNFSTSMLDSSIQPLVPVLRDNFWLSTHVTAVTSSYACFAFSWIIANFVLLKRMFGNRSNDFVERWNAVIRMGMQIGSVFLAGGVILGGVWADYSWGRFWGWDPKETWSLVALVVYISILHGRYVGWFRGVKFTIMAALSFLSVIMAWFGVNYILAVGLHSYGFSSGGAAFITLLTVAQLTLVFTSLWAEKRPSRRVA